MSQNQMVRRQYPKMAGSWMVISTKMIVISFDPSPYVYIYIYYIPYCNMTIIMVVSVRFCHIFGEFNVKPKTMWLSQMSTAVM